MWLVQSAVDQMKPKSEAARRAFELILLTDPTAVPRCAFLSQFIDDVPMLCVESVQREVQMVQAEVWRLLGYEPQGKKVWPEGGFESS